MEVPAPDVKAVFWDFGGVLTSSPFASFAAYERERDLPAGFIRSLNATNPDTNAWAAFERGHLEIDAFVRQFEAEARAAGATVDARALLGGLGGELRPAMVEAVRRCHQRVKTGLLTNNFIRPDEAGSDGAGGFAYAAVLPHFDVVIESSRSGLRKPDLDFYRMACDRLDVHPANAVFLDDLGVNLKPARAMGMHTIKVTDPDAALIELESVVGFPLRAQS